MKDSSAPEKNDRDTLPADSAGFSWLFVILPTPPAKFSYNFYLPTALERNQNQNHGNVLILAMVVT